MKKMNSFQKVSGKCLNNCALHSRYVSDELELDAQIFYQKKEQMFTSGTICAKIYPWVIEKTTEFEKRVIMER